MDRERQPEISRHLRRVEPEQLVEMGESVRGLLDHPGWAVVKGIIDAEERAQLDELMGPVAGKEAPEYARALGVIQGVRLARTITDVVLQKAEAADEELREIAARAA